MTTRTRTLVLVPGEDRSRLPLIVGDETDPNKLSESEQKIVNTLLGALRKDISALDRKIEATHQKYDRVLQTIDENLAKLDEGDEDGEDEDSAPRRRRVDRDKAVDGEDEDEEDGDRPSLDGRDSLSAEEVRRMIAFEQRRNRKQIEKLQKAVEERDRKAQEAEQRSREAIMSRMLATAASKANAADPRAATKLLMDRVRWDDEKGYPIYTTLEGAEFPMTEDGAEEFEKAVADDMPDWMRRAVAGAGGSGAASPGKAADRLEGAMKELDALKKKAEETAQDHDIARYHAKKREVEGIQAELEKSRPRR